MAHKSGLIVLDTGPLDVHAVTAVARRGAKVGVSPRATAAMKASRKVVDGVLKSGEAFYGINTGFGSLAKRRIVPEDLAQLQVNLIRSHSAGIGEPLAADVTRGMMLLLAASLSRGLSGVRPEVVDLLVVMLNSQITPVVPSIGSVGASGDLAPLAAVALAMIGEGEVVYKGRRMRADKALGAVRAKPIQLQAKEGLALINGTHLMGASAALLVGDADRLFSAAVLGLAMSIDACRATDAFLDQRLYEARRHAGAFDVALRVRELLVGSTIISSHLENDPRVQDPYSLRAGPTVLGSVQEALACVGLAVYSELGAVTDNPLVFSGSGSGRGAGAGTGAGTGTGAGAERAIVSGANFHGMPMALPLDYLAIALAHIAGISERRSYLMTGAFEPESNLKPFLAPQPGLQSGLMIAQYTAAAACNEIIGLCMPASVSNISTCAGMEDYNSFGPRAAAKAGRILDLARHVVAVELIVAAQGVQTHRPLRSGKVVEGAIKQIRKAVPPLLADRPLTKDIQAVAKMICDGAFHYDEPE